MAINIWLECEGPDSNQKCILAIGDNTSAIGWLHNTSRLDPTWAAHDAHLVVSRKIAKILMDKQSCIASQHLKGELNVVADWLSFVADGRGKEHPLAFDDPPDDVLTERFLKLLPSQVPENFRIEQLPKEILSWVVLVLRISDSSLTDDKKVATKDPIAPGEDGPNSVRALGAETTISSISYQSSSANSSQDPSSASIGLPSGIAMGDLQELVKFRWSQVLCAKPQATWLRRSGSISGTAPCTSRELPTCVPQSDPS